MKLGFITAILDGFSFEEVADTAERIGFECLELAAWPRGNAERRYAGVTHVDLAQSEQGELEAINAICQDKNLEISALAYYPNTITDNLQERELHTNHLKRMIQSAHRLNTDTVTTFVGRIQTKTVEENLEIFQEVFTPIIRYAEEHKVKLAIENCPMLFDAGQWPGGQNLMTTPAIWRKAFSLIESDYFGLNYDPSHFVWQGIDYIKPLYEFKDKIFHVHCKDIKIYPDKLKDVGSMAYPLQYMSPKLPGLGDVNWGKYISALSDIGYDGYVCLEIEDKAFEGSREKILDSLRLSYRYMRQFVI